MFVKALGIELAAFDTRELGANQRGAVLEIFGAMLAPKPRIVPGERPSFLYTVCRSSSDGRIAEGCPRERVIEKVINRLKNSWPTDCP